MITQRIPSKHTQARNRAFDALRLLFAAFVIFFHAAELTDGNPYREYLTRISPLTFGAVGVYGFFMLSGFLIYVVSSL